MGVNKILLVEKDLEYGRALARAVSNYHGEFEITIVSPETRGKTRLDKKTDFYDYDLILIGGYPDGTAEAIRDKNPNHGRLVILTEYIVENLINQSKNEENHFWYIYKYANVNDIISDLNYLIGSVTGKKSLLRKSFAPELIGFYSISGGTGKSVIALGASRELSRYHDKKVLYLCFEEIPATGLFIENNSENRNMGDYLYYLFEKRDENICRRPEGFTSSDDYGVESFYPSDGRNDLNYLTQEELIGFFKIISDSCRYDYIALDLKSDLSEETMFLMNLCSKIILIQNDDPVSDFKHRKLIAYLSRLSSFKHKERFIFAVNKANSPGIDMENRGVLNKNSGSICIEKDENSFRFILNHLEIDINHIFGTGVKKIADEILNKERTICMGNSVP